MISNISAGLASGGTVDGDLVVTGDFKVEGAGSFAYDEIIQGTVQIAQSADSQGLKITGYDDRNDKHANLHISSGGDFDITASGHVQINGGGNLYLYDYVLVQDRITKTGAGTLDIGGTYDVDLHFLGTGDATVMAIDNGTKRVGIGTESPSALLSVGKDLTSTTTPAFIINENASYRGEFGYSQASNTQMWFNNTYANSGAVMQFRMGGSTKMTLTGAGNVKSGNAGGWYLYNGAPSSVVPAYAFADDTDTGIGQDGANNLTFISGGSKKLQLDANSRISLSNNDNGTSNTLFGKNTGNLIGSGGNHNVFIGELSASQSAMTGVQNVGLGYESLKNLSTGSNLIAIGYQAGKSTTTNGHSVIIGQGAGRDGNVASYSVLVGNFAGYKSTGDITAVGSSAGSNLTSGIRNTYFGSSSGFGNHTGSYNTYVGWRSGYGVADNANNSNTAVGYQSLFAITTGDGNVALGYEAMKTLTQSNNNVAIGKQALSSILAGDGANIALGYNSGRDVTSGNKNIFIGEESGMMQTTGSGSVNIGHNVGRLDSSSANVIIGHLAFSASNNSSSASNVILGFESATGINSASSEHNIIIGRGAGTGGGAQFTKNIAIGSYALDGTGANAIEGTIAIGYQALSALTSGANSTAIGYQAGKAITTASNSTFIGYNAGQEHVTGDSNTAIGTNAMYDSNGVAGYHNTFLGVNSGAGGWTTSAPTYNVGIGNFTLDGAMNGANNNVALGYSALGAVTTGHSNVGLGSNALDAVTSGHTSVGIGRGAGGSLTTGYAQVAIGYNALATEDAGLGSVAVGYQALHNQNVDGDSGNVAVGSNSGHGVTTGTNNSLLGFRSGVSITTGSANVAIGANSGDSITSGANNALLGFESAKSMTIGAHNVAIGREALATEDVGNIAIGIGSYALFSQNSDSDNEQSGNISIGYSSSYYNVTGTNNTALGSFAMQGASGQSNSNNTAIGYKGLFAVTTGDNNVAVGSSAGDSITTGSNNVIIGYGSEASAVGASNQIVIGASTTGLGDNYAVIGNASVTKVYMAQDATDGTTQTEGAEILAKSGYFKRVALDGSLTGGSATTDNPILTLHGSYNQTPLGSNGHSLKFVMQDNGTNSASMGETARIATVSRSGALSSGISTFGTDFEFHNRVGGSSSALTKQMTLMGGDGRAKMIIHGNNAGSGGGVALEVHNDGNDANRDGIQITIGADDASGTTAYIDAQDGNGDQVGHISNTSGTFALTDVSDKRLKKNIVDTSVKGVKTIDKMKVRDFEWIKSGDKMTAGFVAQELAEAFPSAVTGEDGAMEDVFDENGNKTGEKIKPMGVSRDVLVPVLIKAVQELSARVKELEGK